LNNFEKIKSMNIDEVAEMLVSLMPSVCETCCFYYECSNGEDDICLDRLKQWLGSEVSE